MVTRIQIVLVDDLDGDTGDVSTHELALDGTAYEIDLSPANLERLRATIAPFLTAGRRLPKGRSAPRRSRPGGPPTTGIRAWWAEHQHRDGLPAHNTHGAIPRRVRDAYTAAHDA